MKKDLSVGMSALCCCDNGDVDEKHICLRKAKSAVHVKAGRARWLGKSVEERKEFMREVGSLGGKATAKKWRKLQADSLST